MTASTSSDLDPRSMPFPEETTAIKGQDRGGEGAGPDTTAARGVHQGPESGGELMQRYCAGDQKAFRLLYSRYRAPLRRLITRLAGNTDEADEIFQEVWTAVIYGRRSYRPTAKFSTYLFSIVHRRLQDRQRRYGRRAAAFDDSGPPPVPEDIVDDLTILPESCAHNAQLQQALLLAIDALPPLQREVFLLKAETDMNLEEIAAATGAKVEATKSRLRYAVVRLRAQLGDWQ